MWCAHLKNRITYLFGRKYRPEKLLLILNSYTQGIISVLKVQAFEIVFCYIWPHFSGRKPLPNKQFSSRAQYLWSRFQSGPSHPARGRRALPLQEVHGNSQTQAYSSAPALPSENRPGKRGSPGWESVGQL